ncbi:pectate lyase [Cellvibrio japonicus]|uniref:Pectate lyase n=1 Tax=Cellvibrio japonicus (strain Ueda107) TaxID=498211 RepID=B3PCK5_CELJU|nr:pectate lyase [Cellvibrio japonicus]ACE85947.1 pectate lyase, putative, pel3C [Cellvibrio japonicus Ueda107]QEI13235.1 pectate lyase [Cellvibrio japonicus]QEI16809.1 pectate lyase [Cellvibrio japonicus]QEI20387.1 pectate lyase [Cellvibrio japonicus]
MLKKIVITAALLGCAASVLAAANRPSGYVTICKIGQTCSVSGTTNVAFGASGQFVYKNLSGTFSCSVATFGSDPIPSKSVKECSIPQSGSGGTTSSSSSSSSSSSGGGSSGSITGASCSNGSTTNVSSTILVTSGTYDGGCRVFNATSALGDGSQSESQKPVFRVENGATLRNVVLGNNAADGIHFYNGGTIDNIRWSNVGEDAFTIKSSGTVNARNITGYAGEDKFIQVNAASTLNVSNCVVDNMGKFLRQNGGTTFKIVVNVDRCQISNMKEGIFRTDSSTSTARITNSRLRNAGSICIGKWASCTSSGITNY